MPPTPPDAGSPREASEIVAWLAGRGPALVALSGGVDSATVASLARAALGPGAVAATVVSGSVSVREIDEARAVARSVGIRHLLVEAEPLDDERYRANGPDRCFRCRTVETAALRELGRAEGTKQFLDGIHRDDLGDDRPGIRAMDDAGFSHPLLWAGWGKAEVRRYARSVALPNHDRPSNACLASRVARGEPITAELLGRVDRAETLLVERGFRRVRVRVQGNDARVEVDPAELPRLEETVLRSEVTDGLRALGFARVTIDPRGYPAREPLPVLR